jgi:hypothetical protein
VLRFEGGSRITITDFGLATSEKLSSEFRTGSIYHMSLGEHWAFTKTTKEEELELS